MIALLSGKGASLTDEAGSTPASLPAGTILHQVGKVVKQSDGQFPGRKLQSRLTNNTSNTPTPVPSNTQPHQTPGINMG